MPRSIRPCGKILLGRLGMIPSLIKQANMLLQNMMANGDVVVNFLSQVLFFRFFLFLGMVMHANEVETKEKGKLPQIKN